MVRRILDCGGMTPLSLHAILLVHFPAFASLRNVLNPPAY